MFFKTKYSLIFIIYLFSHTFSCKPKESDHKASLNESVIELSTNKDEENDPAFALSKEIAEFQKTIITFSRMNEDKLPQDLQANPKNTQIALSEDEREIQSEIEELYIAARFLASLPLDDFLDFSLSPEFVLLRKNSDFLKAAVQNDQESSTVGLNLSEEESNSSSDFNKLEKVLLGSGLLLGVLSYGLVSFPDLFKKDHISKKNKVKHFLKRFTFNSGLLGRDSWKKIKGLGFNDPFSKGQTLMGLRSLNNQLRALGLVGVMASLSTIVIQSLKDDDNFEYGQANDAIGGIFLSLAFFSLLEASASTSILMNEMKEGKIARAAKNKAIIITLLARVKQVEDFKNLQDETLIKQVAEQEITNKFQNIENQLTPLSAQLHELDKIENTELKEKKIQNFLLQHDSEIREIDKQSKPFMQISDSIIIEANNLKFKDMRSELGIQDISLSSRSSTPESSVNSRLLTNNTTPRNSLSSDLGALSVGGRAKYLETSLHRVAKERFQNLARMGVFSTLGAVFVAVRPLALSEDNIDEIQVLSRAAFLAKLAQHYQKIEALRAQLKWD